MQIEPKEIGELVEAMISASSMLIDIQQRRDLTQHPVEFSNPYNLGQAYLFRLVTHYWIGRVVSVGAREIVIEKASWVANTGRFADCLKSGNVDECERVPGYVIVGRGALVDACAWEHDLSEGQKS